MKKRVGLGLLGASLPILMVVGWLLSAESPTKNSASPTERSLGSPRLVLLYATCTLNKSFLGPYDASVRYTPSLNAFASRSLVFERHQTESGQSGIAFASLFTGTQATEHGLFYHPQRLSDGQYLITEAFAEAGYETFSFLAHGMASAELNYAQGVPAANVVTSPLMGDSPEFRAVLQRVRIDPTFRAFVVTNFSVTHGPYDEGAVAPFCQEFPDQCPSLGEPRRVARLERLYMTFHRDLAYDFERFVRERRLTVDDVELLKKITDLRYRANVRRLDRQFGGVVGAIETMGLTDESIVAFTADHGEAFVPPTEPFRWSHGYQLAPESMGVPLILSGPSTRIRRGTYDGVSRSIDVFPTLAGVSGIDLKGRPGLGVDLSRANWGGRVAPRDHRAESHVAFRR